MYVNINGYSYLYTYLVMYIYLVSNVFIYVYTYACMYVLLCILQIVTEELDVRSYKKSNLKEIFKEDLFPPHFNVKIKCPNLSDVNTLNLDYKIRLKSHGKVDRDLSLNIFIPGNAFNQPLQTTIPAVSFTGIYAYIFSMYNV